MLGADPHHATLRRAAGAPLLAIGYWLLSFPSFPIHFQRTLGSPVWGHLPRPSVTLSKNALKTLTGGLS